MTHARISGLYKLFSLVTLVISVVILIFIDEEGIGIGLKVGIGIMFNLLFHFPYHFLSRAPLEMYRDVEREKPEQKTSALRMFRLFSWTAMVFSAIMVIGLLIIAITEPQVLLGLMTFIAVFLGGYSSAMKLSEI